MNLVPAPRNMPEDAQSSLSGSPGLRGFFRRLFKPVEALEPQPDRVEAHVLPLDQFSITGLRAELRVCDQEILVVQTQLLALEAAEREALSRRDKLALDVAWEGRQTQGDKLTEIEARRELVFEALGARVQPEVDAWKRKAEAEVQGWRQEDEHNIAAMHQHLRQLHELGRWLIGREAERAQRRQQLCADFETLAARAEPVIPLRPELDWTIPSIDATPLLDALESTVRDLRQYAVGEAA